MAFIYITGAPGIGKSTIQKKLRDLGFEAYDLDNPKFGGPHNKVSGKLVIIPPAEARDDSWFDQHEWRIYRESFLLWVCSGLDPEQIHFNCNVFEPFCAMLGAFYAIRYIDKLLIISREVRPYTEETEEGKT